MTRPTIGLGRLVALVDPGRMLYRLTRGGRVPLIGAGGHPALPAALREHGTIVRLDAGDWRALVAFPSAPHGLWFDVAELEPLATLPLFPA